jgi:AraC-like DNA-binding protein
MILNLISFFIGIVLILFIPILFFNRNSRKKSNAYFFAILANAGIQRFTNGLEVFGMIGSTINPFQRSLLFAFLIPPVYYLFFENLLLKKTPLKKDIVLFAIPASIIILSLYYNFNQATNQMLFLIYSTAYLIGVIRILIKQLFNKKNLQELAHYKTIKYWALIMFAFFVITYAFANYILNLYSKQNLSLVLNHFYNSTSVIWLFIIIYLFMNPVILYGEQLLFKKLNNHIQNEIPIWKTSKKRNTEIIDLIIEKKIKPNLDSILFDINIFEVDLLKHFKALPTLKEMAEGTNHPQSHLKYMFKYYSFYSFSEYLNILKIKYALQLLNSGYLDDRTIDSLSLTCLFSNRSTFFKNFKKHTGYSPSNYVLTIAGK